MQSPYNINIYAGTGSVDGQSGDHLIISPAYNLTAEDVERIVTKLQSVIQYFFDHTILSGQL